MGKKFLATLAAIMLVFSLGACKKKEGEKPIPRMGPGMVMPPGETMTVVPESVKGKWTAVELMIEDKAARKTSNVSIKLGGEHTIAGSDLKVEVGEFLPDFKMEGIIITSASNELNNPAVRVVVFEGGNEIFKGWLYSKFPAIHPFQHEKYGISLNLGIKKG